MKEYAVILLVLLSVSCGSTENKTVQSEPYTGEISAAQLLTDYVYFREIYDLYQPSKKELNAAKSLSGKSILVLFGTWCHDSEREIPRLLKLLDSADVKLESLSLHGVNYHKQDPKNLHRKFGIRYTPTIILLEGEQELGRIVEKPVQSLGEDLAGLVQKN